MMDDDFREWLMENNIYKTKKQVSDCVSRVKRAERAFGLALGDEKFSFDDAYNRDKGQFVITAISRRGRNSEMASMKNIDLPVGTNQMDSISSAVKKYFGYLSR